jgi:hypothetical protein
MMEAKIMTVEKPPMLSVTCGCGEQIVVRPTMECSTFREICISCGLEYKVILRHMERKCERCGNVMEYLPHKRYWRCYNPNCRLDMAENGTWLTWTNANEGGMQMLRCPQCNLPLNVLYAFRGLDGYQALLNVKYCMRCEKVYFKKPKSKRKFSFRDIEELHRLAETLKTGTRYNWNKIKQRLSPTNTFKQLSNVQLSKAYSKYKHVAEGLCYRCKTKKAKNGILFCQECAKLNVENVRAARLKKETQKAIRSGSVFTIGR